MSVSLVTSRSRWERCCRIKSYRISSGPQITQPSLARTPQSRALPSLCCPLINNSKGWSRGASSQRGNSLTAHQGLSRRWKESGRNLNTVLESGALKCDWPGMAGVFRVTLGQRWSVIERANSIWELWPYDSIFTNVWRLPKGKVTECAKFPSDEIQLMCGLWQHGTAPQMVVLRSSLISKALQNYRVSLVII